MNALAHVSKFWQLAAEGKSAALDINIKTGELACQYSQNVKTGAEGNGTPGIPDTADYMRIIVCEKGVVHAPSRF